MNSMDEIERRIQALERRHARHTRATLITLLTMVVWSVVLLAWVGSRATRATRLEAREFVVLDADGRRAGAFGVDDQGFARLAVGAQGDSAPRAVLHGGPGAQLLLRSGTGSEVFLSPGNLVFLEDRRGVTSLGTMGDSSYLLLQGPGAFQQFFASTYHGGRRAPGAGRRGPYPWMR